jgi:hypothetical protein
LNTLGVTRSNYIDHISSAASCFKKSWDKFKALVRSCTDPTKEIDKVRVGKFVGRARAYICAYFELSRPGNQQNQAGEQNQEADDNVSKRQQAHFVDIERLTKSFKTHRCALDFDSGFISSMFVAPVKAKTTNAIV